MGGGVVRSEIQLVLSEGKGMGVSHVTLYKETLYSHPSESLVGR